MLSFLLRRVLPGRLVPFLALWEVYTAARWLYGLREAAQRRHRPTRLVVSGDPLPAADRRTATATDRGQPLP